MKLQALLFVFSAGIDSVSAAPTDRVGFPNGYETWEIVRNFDRKAEGKHITIFANVKAASITSLAGLPYPPGSVFVMETTIAGKDPQGKPTGDSEGPIAKGRVTGLHVMRREAGFGAGYGKDRSGEWEFVEYAPDGKTLTTPEKSTPCAACHVGAGAGRDFVFRGRFPALGPKKE